MIAAAMARLPVESVVVDGAARNQDRVKGLDLPAEIPMRGAHRVPSITSDSL
jgi:hypothetical protein